ncbi:MAG: MFS transporter, partial [Pseudomonadota bacterium]|nr:MFS transporter [Pseudomonadota bacterium]
IGTLIGLFMLPGLFLAIPAGLAGTFFSDKALIGFGLIALSLGGTIAGLSQGFGFLSVGRVICGIGFVVSTIFFAKVLIDWFEGKELATAMSVLVMSWPFGIAMGQVGHGWLSAFLDWRWAFYIASLYCAVSAALMILLYCGPVKELRDNGSVKFSLNKSELILTLTASLAWGFFNAGYVVYLSFSPLVLMSSGHSAIAASSIVSAASWVMIFSGAICGFISDKTRRPNLIIYICMGACILSFLMLLNLPFPLISVLIFGLVGMAPAGILMALSAEAMRVESRSIGMGVFFMGQVLLQSTAPPVAGWLYDVTNDVNLPILFAVALFLATGASNYCFQYLKIKHAI